MSKLLIICGPTATGKTSFALEVARKLNGELVSADSRQVYSGMDIVTGKDLPLSLPCPSEVFNEGGVKREGRGEVREGYK